MNPFQRLKCFLMYRKAVLEAEKAHKEHNVRYYVLPNIGKKVMLIVCDRKNFRVLRAKHYISSDIQITDVKKKSFYYTEQGDGTGKMEDDQLRLRQTAYQFWYAQRIMQMKEERKAFRKAQRKARWKKNIAELKAVFKHEGKN